MSLLANERTKLLANALDRASTACVTVGILAPIAAVVYGLPGNSSPTWVFILATVFWFFCCSNATYGGKERSRRFVRMSALELFAAVLLPLVVAAGGWLAAILHKRGLQKMEPIETQMPERDRSTTTSIYVVAPRSLPALLRQLSRNNQAQPRLH